MHLNLFMMKNFKNKCLLGCCLLLVHCLHAQMPGIIQLQKIDDNIQFFQTDGRQWAVAKSGDTVFQGNYDQCLPQFCYLNKRCYLSVQKDGKAGLIDLQKNVIVPFQFNKVEYTGGYDNFVLVWSPDGRCGIWNLQGREVIPPTYYSIVKKERGYFKVQDFDTQKAGLIDSLGQIRLPLEYGGCDVELSPGIWFKASKDMLWALFDLSGKQLTEFRYLNFHCNPYSTDMLFAQKTRRVYDVMDKNGAILPILPVEDFIFFSKVVAVLRNNTWAYLLPDGRQLTEFKYESVDRVFSDYKARKFEKDLGVASPDIVVGKATRDGKTYVITLAGKEILVP